MSIKRTIITTIVALALVAVVAPGVAQGVTIADLMAQIAQLTAQLNTLQGTSSPTTGTGLCAGVTFTRNLVVGSTGSDVRCLQSILNQNQTTQVAVTGAGSPGHETSYFGQLTLVAVKKYQVQHGWTPANQVGPLTRAALNASLGSTGGTNNPPVVVPTGAGLTVQLAYDNPASTTVVAGQALATLARLTFVNGDNAPVNVTGLNLTRIGVSADTDLTNVYLFNGATRLTDAASVSSGMVNFNASSGLFTVPAGSSVEVTVAADLYSSAAAGETLGIALTAATNVTTNASSVKGNFPVNGNLMSMVSAPSTIGTVYTTAASLSPLTTCTATTCTIDPQNDYPVYQQSFYVGNHAMNLMRFSLREIGSVNYSDIRNYRLYVDGVQVGAAVAGLDSNGYITFNLTSSPLNLTTATHVFKVLADIVGGSSRSFSFSLQTASDATFFETQYNVNVTLHLTNSTTTYTTQTTGATGINSGTITVAKTIDSPSGNIINTASNAVLGRFTLTAAGEPVKVSSIKAAAYSCPSASNVGLRNGAIYANGVQVGSTATLLCSNDGTASSLQYTLYQMGSSLIVNPGSPVTLEIRADVYATGSVALVAATDSIEVELITQTGNAQGQVSLGTANVPSSTVLGNSLAVTTGGLALTKFTAYTNQALVATGQSLKLADFTLSANTTEAVNINTIAVTLNTITYTNVTNLYVTYAGNTTTAKATTVSSTDGNSFPVNYTLPVGASIDLSVYGTVALGYTNGTASYMGVLVSGTTASSATAVTTGGDADTSGQNLTFRAGSIAEAQDAGTPLAGVVSGGQTITAAKYRITASYDSFTVTEMMVSPSSSSAVIASAMLVDDATGATLATRSSLDYTYTTDYYFTGLNLVIPANTSKTVTVKYVLVTPDSTASTDQLNVKSTFDKIRYINGSGVQSSLTAVSSVAGNALYVFKSVPTFTQVPEADATSQGTQLSAGAETTLYRFTVAAPTQGEVDLKQIKFSVSVSSITGFGSPELNTFKIFRNGVQLTSVAIMDASNNSLASTTTYVTTGTATVVSVLFTSSSDEAIPAGQTYAYELRATATGFGKNTNGANSVSTQLLGNDTINTAQKYDYGTDSTVHQLAQATSGTLAAAENLIWSDHSASTGHSSDTASGHASSADWSNSMSTYLGLPLTSQGISAQ